MNRSRRDALRGNSGQFATKPTSSTRVAHDQEVFMDDEKTITKRIENWASQPFMPVPGASTEMRVAAALEYIAAQLGQINVKMDNMADGSDIDDDEES